MKANLGKVIRLNPDGSVPSDNPFAEQGGVAAQIWTLGHRNPLGLAFDSEGRLWLHEMGPRGGDEFNLIVRGKNYGWPVVSNGDHYDGKPIPDHDTRPEFEVPKASWSPVISPAGKPSAGTAGQRIREVEQGPTGTIWLLEDGPAGSGGRLLELRPTFD